jgi:hypothetical protein
MNTANAETVERLLGTCPICEGTYKVRGGVMVHHGFKRPGDGMIHGDCFAVGAPPYEVSCEITKVYRAQIESHRANVAEVLSGYQARTVTRFSVSRLGCGWPTRIVETDYALGVTELYAWDYAFDHQTRELASRVRMLDSEIARLTQLVDTWEPRDIRTVMEEKARHDKAAREARAAEVQAKRDAKAQKAAELKARREARAARMALK